MPIRSRIANAWIDPVRSTGYTLVEVMVASVVFLVAASAALAAIGGMQRTLANSNRAADASFVLQTVADRLYSSSSYLCPGAYNSVTDLLADDDAGAPNLATLGCFGFDSVGIGACTPDYPRTGAVAAVPDLKKLLGQSFDGAASEFVFGFGNDPSGIPQVTYKGNSYRVVWNVVCSVPVTGMKTVQVTVGWPPYATALSDGRFVTARFTKGEGI